MKKILIADDDDEMRNLIVAILEDEGYEIHLAQNGVQTLEIINEIKPDLVILDIMMPGKTGYQVCKELKENPETKDIYVLILSARGSNIPGGMLLYREEVMEWEKPDDISISERAGKRMGGDAFMAKPFEPDDLLDKVNKILK